MAAPSLLCWCRGWPPRAPERNPHRPLPHLQTLAAAFKAAPTGLPDPPPPWGIPPESAAIHQKSEGGRRSRGREEAPEAREKLGAAMVRGLRRRARATMSRFVKEERWRPFVEEPKFAPRWTTASPPACRRGCWTGERSCRGCRAGAGQVAPSPSRTPPASSSPSCSPPRRDAKAQGCCTRETSV
jgi:hypothetical protein